MNRNRRIWTVIGMTVVLLITGLLITTALPGADASAETPPAELRGISFFYGELMETGYVFQSKEVSSSDTIATLIHLDGDQYELRVSDLFDPSEPRISIWKLTISEDGDITGGTFFERQVYPIPETSTFDEIWTHTGCMMTGGFPEVTGTWDGERLLAYTVFEGRCEGGTYWGGLEYWGEPAPMEDGSESPVADGLDWSDGRAHMEFGVDMTVVP